MTIALRPPETPLPTWLAEAQAAVKERDRILRGKFFLVRTAGNGQAWRCRNCGGHHRYLTLCCVEQPFSGLSSGIYAYWKTIGKYGGERYLSPGERARYDRLNAMFGTTEGLPDFASSHPLTARTLIRTGECESDRGAITMVAPSMTSDALGVVEPIDAEKARRLALRINSTGIKPAFCLEGILP